MFTLNLEAQRPLTDGHGSAGNIILLTTGVALKTLAALGGDGILRAVYREQKEKSLQL